MRFSEVTSTRPLFSYYGGKQRLAPKVLNLIREMPHTVYTEPFAGGAAVLFAKGRPDVSATAYREVINDTHDLIVNLYRVARSHPAELQRRLELTLYSQAEYRRSVEICRDGHEDPIELAWAAYVNLQMSFANKLSAGWGRGVLGGNKAATWANKLANLPLALARLKDVHIGSEDALKFIRRWDSPQTLHYCDPPYPGTDCGHYGGYTIEDFKSLVECLDGCQGSFILSNYPQDFTPPDNWHKVEIPITSSASGKGKVGADRSKMPTQEALGDRRRVEVLWWVDRSANARPDVQRLYQKIKDAAASPPEQSRY
jgi:DNA adenine methylase